MEDRTGRLLLERMRRLEERMERDSERLRVDLRARQQVVAGVVQRTREEVAAVRRDLDEALQRLEGSLDRQGTHFGDWLIEVETRFDELVVTRAGDLRDLRTILEEHLAGSATALEDHEARLRRLEQGPAA